MTEFSSQQKNVTGANFSSKDWGKKKKNLQHARIYLYSYLLGSDTIYSCMWISVSHTKFSTFGTLNMETVGWPCMTATAHYS